MSQEVTYWKKCSSCKKEIGFNTAHKLCSVSTCRGKRTGYVFCSVACWDAHLGFANHRESYAEEHHSPSKAEYLQSLQEPEASDPIRKKIISPTPASVSPTHRPQAGHAPIDTLVVVSKVKAFIKEQSGFNTSACCIDALTEKVADECRKAMENAQQAGRKTVMGRDVF